MKKEPPIKTSAEFHAKDLPIVSGGGLSAREVMAIQQETNDIKERLLKDVSDKLFDPSLLNMISRLDNNLAFYLIKHLIINGFYAKFYYGLKYEIKIKQIDKPPFYSYEPKYTDDKAVKLMRESYDTFLRELREVTISFKGQGRAELVGLFESLNERVRRDEMKQGILGKFGLGT